MKKAFLTILLSLTFVLSSCELPDGLFPQSNVTDSGSSSISVEGSHSGESDSDSDSSSSGSKDSSSDDNIDNSSEETSSDSSEETSSDSSEETSSDSSEETSSDSSEETSSDSSEETSSDSSEDSSGDSSSDIETEEVHKDIDNNAYCDDCGEKVTVTFDIFSVNDLHGKLTDGDNHPGVDELTTYLKNAKAKNENTILLSAGDMWQGASESNLTQGNIITDWMNELDFVSMTLGNHEYDWGEEAIIANAAMAEFPFLAINVYDNATHQRVDYCDASVMIDMSGVQIGIIGAMGDCYSSISADKVEDVYFVTGSALASLVKTESSKLRNAGADFIIYAIHDGGNGSIGSYYDTSLSNGYVDLVFEGHSHQQYVVKDSYGVYHLQGGGDNKGVSHANITINFANAKTSVGKAEFISTGSYTHLTPDSVVEDLLEKYDEKLSQASRLLGKNDKLRSSTEICQTVADLYYKVALEKWGDEYDIVLGGGFLNTRAPYELSAGNIYYGDLVNVLPFDNQIVLCSIQGRYLKSKFFDLPERYYISYGEYGESVKANIQNNKTYYLVTDRYTSLYTSNNLTEIEFYDDTTYARDLLAEYIEAGNWTQPVTMTDIPTLLSIAQGLGDNKETAEVYYVTGKIISIASASLYGNITIEDENGNQLYIYGTWDINGNRYGNMANKPQVGDTVVLCGAMKKYVYNGKVTLEMQNGIFQNL